LPIFATIFINITPVLARVSFSIPSPTAGPVFKSVFVFFISPFSILPINAVSIFSPSPIRSLSSLIYSDLAAKYVEFECDYLLPASSILPADAALSLSPYANLMPNLVLNVFDTDFLIKLTTFRDALVCLLPAAFDAVVKVLAMLKLSNPV
jgi:hypothetical protein